VKKNYVATVKHTMSMISSLNLNHLSVNDLSTVGSLDVAGPLSVVGSASIVGSATVSGTVTAGGVVNTGNSSVTGTLLVTGASTLSGGATVGNLSLGAPVVVSAATATITSSQSVVIGSFAGAMTLTLPTPASLVGRVLIIKNDVAQTVASASANVIPLAGGAAGTAILTNTAGKFAVLVSNGTAYVTMAAA
jgi:hypothetical protein